MDFNTLHKQRKFVMIAAAVGILMLLIGLKYGLGGEGVITLLAFAGAGYFAYSGDQKKPMAKNAWLGTIGCGSLIILLFLINTLRFGFSILQYASFDFWLLILSAIAIVAAAYMFRDPNQDLKQSLSDMKKSVENKLDNDPNT
jgi:uncharacterized membrane protein YjdF